MAAGVAVEVAGERIHAQRHRGIARVVEDHAPLVLEALHDDDALVGRRLLGPRSGSAIVAFRLALDLGLGLGYVLDDVVVRVAIDGAVDTLAPCDRVGDARATRPVGLNREHLGDLALAHDPIRFRAPTIRFTTMATSNASATGGNNQGHESWIVSHSVVLSTSTTKSAKYEADDLDANSSANTMGKGTERGGRASGGSAAEVSSEPKATRKRAGPMDTMEPDASRRGAPKMETPFTSVSGHVTRDRWYSIMTLPELTINLAWVDDTAGSARRRSHKREEPILNKHFRESPCLGRGFVA